VQVFKDKDAMVDMLTEFTELCVDPTLAYANSDALALRSRIRSAYSDHAIMEQEMSMKEGGAVGGSNTAEAQKNMQTDLQKQYQEKIDLLQKQLTDQYDRSSKAKSKWAMLKTTTAADSGSDKEKRDRKSMCGNESSKDDEIQKLKQKLAAQELEKQNERDNSLQKQMMEYQRKNEEMMMLLMKGQQAIHTDVKEIKQTQSEMFSTLKNFMVNSDVPRYPC